ncbi:WcbI family polysaccharide biosynthesis putative acetyltransferase [Roseovarius sp.]|uniref:WcbI family polysaccharide biosynthesis putative acetyltransferase n=1 Tax=Roseovarius sp. TaxID=1486281 RepID=UPI003BAB16C5
MSGEARRILVRTAKAALPDSVVGLLKRRIQKQPPAAAPHLRRTGTECHSVLLVSNCATPIYAKVLERVCPSVKVTAYDDRKAQRDRAEFLNDCARNDTVVLMPLRRDVAVQEGVDESKIVVLPPFYFSGYHPDTIYLAKPDNTSVTTRFGAYHSSICYLGHQAGLGIADTVSLFTEEVYREMEFFTAWQTGRDNLLGAFAEAGMPIAPLFRRWARQGCFMHTVNHPHAHALVDVGRLAAARIPVERRDVDLPVPDFLANGPSYPCYPEIAEAVGARGSYFFKPAQADDLMTLTEFVAMCYDTYSGFPHGALRIRGWPPRKTRAFEACIAGRFGG